MQYLGEDMRSNSYGEVSPTVVNGKRTKHRHTARLPSRSAVVFRAAASSASSAESMSATTEEDEDMANCLILLARGGALSPPAEEKFTRPIFTEGTTAITGKAGFYVYECKTCNKRFPSFQALGGHRTSHKKPKIALQAAETTKILNENNLSISMASSINRIMIHNNNGKNNLKVHECSICGSEFPSGQALGGHMRRHRIVATSPEAHDGSPKGRSFLSMLDLNLPPPCDDDSNHCSA